MEAKHAWLILLENEECLCLLKVKYDPSLRLSSGSGTLRKKIQPVTNTGLDWFWKVSADNTPLNLGDTI